MPPCFRESVSARHDPAARILNVDLLTVLIAVLLPWTTTGVSIAVVLWAIAFAFTIESARFPRLAQAARQRAAARLRRAGAARHAVVGGAVARTACIS